MVDDTDPRSTKDQDKTIAVKDAASAPVIYFDFVPTFGFNNGVVNLMLAVGLVMPTTDGGALTESAAVAHLRCNVPAAVQLRDTINKALLLAAPTSEGKAN
jgi:hypothetical protein